MGSGGDRLVVIDWNVGDHGTQADLKGMLDRCDVLCLQEMGDRDGFYDCLHDHGWKTYDAGGDNGRHSTPIAWDPKAMGPVNQHYCKQLSPKTHAPGTGPDDVKAKWLIGCAWDYPNYQHQVRVGCLHLVSDSGKDNQKRHDLAHDEIVNASTMWRKADGTFPVGPMVIAGDWNTSWDNDLLDPMRNQHWKPSQGCDGYVCHTHGNWTPDQQWWRNAAVYKQGQIRTGSDHDAYWVSYTLS
jgi:hypothetical protein